MKKEIFAFSLLIIMFAAAVCNLWYLSALADGIEKQIDIASELALRENWTQAEHAAQTAIDLWEDKNVYTHMVMPHAEVETLTDALYAMRREVSSKNANTAVISGENVKSRLDALISREKVTVSSVF